MWLVTSVCLYIYMSLMYERVLEKCFWGTGKSWKSPGNFSVGTLQADSSIKILRYEYRVC